MIEVYRLEDLLKKYGIDTNKILSKNNKILDRGEYQDIDRTLNYLINEVGISPRNIEKCPSIMYYAIDNIRGNYEFLIKQGVNISSIETALHILNTEPKILKETYYYVLDNYGNEYINSSTTILKVPVDRVIAIEKILSDKSLILSAAYSWNSVDEIEKIIEICKKYNIPITGSVFHRTADEIEKIVEICKKYNIPITGSTFLKTADELEKIIEICKENNIPTTGSIFFRTADEIKEIIEVCGENNIPITGSTFLKTADEIEEIIIVCKENNIPITGSIFLRTADEIEKIVEVCKKNDISITGCIFRKTADEIEEIIVLCKKYNVAITGSIFYKTADELEESIDYVKSIYGEAYLKPLIVNKNVEYLKVVLPYLDSLNVLPFVIKSASILSLSLDEIMERKEYIESHNGELVLPNGRFNSIFGLSRANYRKLIGRTRCI